LSSPNNPAFINNQFNINTISPSILNWFDTNNKNLDNINMTKNIITLKINNTNGTIIIPKKIRDSLNFNSILLAEVVNNELVIRSTKNDLEKVFGSVKPLKAKYTDSQIKEMIRKEQTARLISESN
jgi:bifunctional DNA-binding transcriptional regulator/antitoxin component of YhaV-PrlF toxin-antitoxin module